MRFRYSKLTYIILVIFLVPTRVAISVELSRDIVIIARHGSLENTPENTLAAFEQTADIGIRGLEVDVRKTNDGKLILMHDDTIDRTTDGKGYVNQLTYEEIKLYDAGSWKSKEFADERVPLLSEVLQFAKDRNMKLIINVKEHGIEQNTLSLIEEFDMINHVYFGGRLQSLRDKDMDVKGAEIEFLPPDEATNDAIDIIHERHNHVGTRLFDTDDRDKMKEKMFQGVDIILTDYPSVAVDLMHFRTKNEPEKRDQRKRLETNIEGNAEQIGALIDTITQGPPNQSRIAALVFSTLPAGLAVPTLVKRLDYKKPLIRFLPNIKIPFLSGKEDKQDKENLLPATTVQKNIVWALGLTKNKNAVEPLIKRLETADSELKREIILALKMIRNKQAVPVLKEMLLKDENPYVRFDAARALGSIDNTDSVFTLSRAMKTDKTWLVKGACAEALGRIGDNRIAYDLKALLNTDAGSDASWARDRAAWALSKIGIGGIEALVSSLGANGASTRRRASWELINIGDPAVPYMLSALKDINPLTRTRAAMILGWIGNKKAVLPLTWTLSDKNRDVREMVAWALGKIGEDSAIAALEHTLENQNEKEESTNEEIAVLKEQRQVLENQVVILENEKILEGDSKTIIPGESAEESGCCYKKLKEVWDFRPVVLSSVILEIVVTERDKIDTSIEILKKGLQDNNGLKENVIEAIQRLNYN